MGTLKTNRRSGKVRDAVYTISAKGNLVVRYQPLDQERSLSKLQSFENRELAKRLLKEIRDLFIRHAPVDDARTRSTHQLLHHLISGNVIDTYLGQNVGLSDLVLSLGRWPVRELCRTDLADGRSLEIRWNPIPGLNESSDDEVILMCCEVMDGELWMWIERGGTRSDGGVSIDCSYVGYDGEINCWIAFKLEERPGEYSENEYLGWVDFTSNEACHETY